MSERILRVVVVDHAVTRRHRLADAARHAGAQPIEVATPLEAIHLVESGEHYVDAIAVADDLTQTRGDELVGYLAAEHPEVQVAVIHEQDGAPPANAAVVVPCDGTDATERFRILMARLEP